MKKIIIILIISVFVLGKLEAKNVTGQIYYKNDTVNVTFKIPIEFLSQEPNYEKIQLKIKYYNSEGVKRTLNPSEAKEIRFTYGYEKIRMVSRENTLNLGNIFTMSKNIFLRLEIDGKLKLFKHYYTQNTPGTYNSVTGMTTAGHFYKTERYILQKSNGELKKVKVLGFRKNMVKYFKDCPELSKKIKNKEFRKADMESIVHFYNRNYN